jgi:adenylyltransferase/sulfurtransferase
MSVIVHIPTALRSFTGGEDEIPVESGSVEEALAVVVERHPDLRPHLYDDEGELRSCVNAYVNEEDIRELDGRGTRVRPGDRITIVPSIAGGAAAGDRPETHGGGPGADVDRPVAPPEPPPPARPGSIIEDSRWQTRELGRDEIQRYSRHLIMPEVGMAGQRENGRRGGGIADPGEHRVRPPAEIARHHAGRHPGYHLRGGAEHEDAG